MLGEAYLTRGLDALCRAHETDYFLDGHRGGAIIAAYYFCREAAVEEGVADSAQDIIDHHWTHTDLCAPFPSETPDLSGIGKVVESLERSMVGLRQAGHNVILPTLALRAFRDAPDAVTPARVEGVVKLIDSFASIEDVTLEEGDESPEWADPVAAAEFILAELLRAMDAFDGRGQGWSGHLLTYGRALFDLQSLRTALLCTSSAFEWDRCRGTSQGRNTPFATTVLTTGHTGLAGNPGPSGSGTCSSIPMASTG